MPALASEAGEGGGGGEGEGLRQTLGISSMLLLKIFKSEVSEIPALWEMM